MILPLKSMALMFSILLESVIMQEILQSSIICLTCSGFKSLVIGTKTYSVERSASIGYDL